jgi:RNA polymerase sigma-70 factor (ECF subfamily)
LVAALPAKLAALPAAAQVVLRLHYLQSLTQQEIAEVLEIPLGTVKSRLAYGLMCLRKTWVP